MSTKIQSADTATYRCDECACEITDMMDVGYLGPKDVDSTDCSPFTAQITLCHKCLEKTLSASRA